MSAKSPREAAQSFTKTRQRSVSCLTDTLLNYRDRDYRSAEPLYLTLAGGDPVRLSAPTPLLLRIRLQFRVAKTGSRGHWEAFTIAYSYSLHDGQDREILAYQWHPRGVSHVTFPHLHVGPGAQLGRQDLARAHLPTGLVALDDFLRLAITAFHVRPRRKEWAEILSASATVPIPLE